MITKPYCREAGAGPAILCLHSNATCSDMKKVRNEFASEIACHEAGVHTTARLATIAAPVQYLVGSRTKASARRVAEVSVPVLQNVSHHVLEGMGHMGPVTHPSVFNDKVGEFLLAGR